MQLKLKKSSFFTILQAVMWPIWSERPRELLALHPSDLYLTLSRLPLDRFLDCLCDGNLESLLISGKVSQAMLNATWLSLLNEYYELKGDARSNEHLMLSRDINRLRHHLSTLQRCLSFLTERYSVVVAECVTQLGYPFDPVNKDPLEYIDELNSIAARSRNKYIQLQQLMKEAEAKTDGLTDARPSREYFESVLSEVESMQHVSYDPTKLMTSRYVLLEKKYWKAVDKQLNKLNG